MLVCERCTWCCNILLKTHQNNGNIDFLVHPTLLPLFPPDNCEEILEESAFRAILVRLSFVSQEITKKPQTNCQGKGRVSPDNSMTETHILMSRILILKFMYLLSRWAMGLKTHQLCLGLHKSAGGCSGENQQKVKGLNDSFGCGCDWTEELTFPQRRPHWNFIWDPTEQDTTQHFHSWLLFRKWVEK